LALLPRLERTPHDNVLRACSVAASAGTAQETVCTPLANNLQGTPAAGLDTLFDAFNRLTHPLDMIEMNGLMLVTGGAVTAIGVGTGVAA